MLSKTYKKNIFCLEADWVKNLKYQYSIKPMLELVSKSLNIDYVWKSINNLEGFKFYLHEITKTKYDKYKIIYLAFHGLPNEISVNNEFLNLDDLGDILRNKLKDKIVYFGSCLTLDVEKDQIYEFLNKTGAVCVIGYGESIPFIKSTMFDSIVIEKLQSLKDMNFLKNSLISEYSKIINDLKFKIEYIN